MSFAKYCCGFPRQKQSRDSPRPPRRSDQMTTSRYLPLDESAHEIRLLTLLPGEKGASIHLRLDFKALIAESPPKYEALSYAWGSVENSKSVFIGDSHDFAISVTQNLASALDHLRHPCEERVLWIDALCIDQQNIDERNQQVQRMGDIFKLADTVLVWLGPEADDSTVALKFLQSIGSTIDVEWNIESVTLNPSSQAAKDGEIHWIDRMKDLPLTPRELKSIYYLLKRSWFQRLWIRQEIFLARRAIIICGLADMSWDIFRNATYMLQVKSRDDESLGYKALEFSNRINMIFDLVRHSPVDSTQSLLSITSLCLYSDPRDRIYAMLNMFSETAGGLDIRPDYRKTVTEVYRDFFLKYVNFYTDGNLQLLSSCEIRETPSQMPSWIPDWSSMRGWFETLSENASGESHNPVVHTANDVLQVEGIKVGTIKEANQVHSLENYDLTIIAAIRKYAPPGMDITGGALFEAYCRTIIAGKFSETCDPPFLEYPSLEEGKRALRLFLERPDEEDYWIRVGTAHLERGARIYLSRVSTCMGNRNRFSTEEGYLGIGPLLAEVGDEVVVLPGCRSPMIFRPVLDGKHKVIGECHADGFMNCEAILGPFPKGYRKVSRFSKETGLWDREYYNMSSGQLQAIDPRFDLLRSELHEDGVRRIYVNGLGGDAVGDSSATEIVMWTGHLRCAEAKRVRVRGVPVKLFTLV